MPSLIRLDRLLANLGYASRSEALSIIRSGRVSHDHVVVRDPSARVSAGGVRLDDAGLDHPLGVLVAVHKPAGYVCSHDDRDGPTVFTLLPSQWLDRTPRPEAVGRLDKDATGLLLVTDDHALVHRLTSPKHHVEKTYLVTLDRPVDLSLAKVFAAGDLVLRGETAPCLPASLVVLADRQAELTITEGRYHQVKRMFAACGHHVEALHRLRVGDWALDDLPEASWRDL